MKSEEDLPPLTRQRSNTLPKSFGSQLEKKPSQEKMPKPPVESTLEVILKKLQEKREEVNRPEDIKVRPWPRYALGWFKYSQQLLHHVTSIRFKNLQHGWCLWSNKHSCGPEWTQVKCVDALSVPLLTGYDTGADRSRESGPAESPAVLREHTWSTSESSTPSDT